MKRLLIPLVVVLLTGPLALGSHPGTTAGKVVEGRIVEPEGDPSGAEALLKSLDPFYKQHVVADGLLVVSSEKVSEYALREAAYLAQRMLANRPDVLGKLVEKPPPSVGRPRSSRHSTGLKPNGTRSERSGTRELPSNYAADCRIRSTPMFPTEARTRVRRT